MSKSPQHDRNRRDAKTLGVARISRSDREIVKQLRREADAARAARRQQEAAERAERARESAARRLAYLRKYDPRSPQIAALEAQLT